MMPKGTDEALYDAADEGNIAQVVTLLDQSANVNAHHGETSQTSLIAAAAAGHEEIVRRLLDWGSAVNAINSFGETALTLAADGGHTAVVLALLDWGAEVNAVDQFGDTPLLNAAWNEQEETLRLLLKRGANPNVSNSIRQTAITTALTFERNNVLSILLEGGADPNLRYSDQTPLMMALLDKEAVRLLLAHGADITLRDKHGKTALQNALEDCAHDAVPLLLSAGATV
jgi:ankyrin repeat protein